MKEKEDDEIVYLDEKSSVAISFEDLQKRLIEILTYCREVNNNFI